jgi:hypothetical protein
MDGLLLEIHPEKICNICTLDSVQDMNFRRLAIQTKVQLWALIGNKINQFPKLLIDPTKIGHLLRILSIAYFWCSWSDFSFFVALFAFWLYTGCLTNIVTPGIRIFDIKGPSKNFNSIHLAWRPWFFLGLRAKILQNIDRKKPRIVSFTFSLLFHSTPWLYIVINTSD